MMPQSINKIKIYFYLLIFLFLSSTFNFNIISKFKKLNVINHINIIGLDEKEKSNLEKNLEIFINKNIFLISKEEAENVLKNISFIDSYSIIKIFPSNLLVNVKKTEFVGKTILNGKKFYIGKNGKFTEISLVEKKYSLPQVFGNFQIDEFLKLQEILSSNGFNLNQIKKYYYFKSNRWDIENKEDIILKLPAQNIEKSIKNYKSLLETNKIIQGQLIDLRMKNKIILKDAKK
tara:strand:+ start:976 stop:1674 length:699 start_codon:yes stop_codon:yes gene_type:complete